MPRSQTVPGPSQVTVVPSPMSQVASTGTARAVTVIPGTDAEAESPDCGHTYTQPSSDDLRAQVTVNWEVTWSGGGEAGTVPEMTTTASVSWPVVESHALVTR